ncbi:MAG: DNA-directed RNA polymerase subunit omega [Armatimonadota bacterium]
MALYPSADKLDAFSSKFVLANLAARRAKQLREGAPPLIETHSTHPLTIALEEIAEGAVVPQLIEGEVVPASGVTGQTLDALAAEGTAAVQDLAALVRNDASIEDLLDLETALTDEEEETVEAVDLRGSAVSGDPAEATVEVGDDADAAIAEDLVD